MNYQRERACAMEAVQKASRLCQSVQQSLVSAEAVAKHDQSPVTVADFGAQAVISLWLQKQFPDIPLVGEENADFLRSDAGAGLRTKVFEHVRAELPDRGEDEILKAIDRGAGEGGAAGRFWVVDPIDGTKGFVRGDEYAVALALIDDGRVVLGVLGCPRLALNPDQPDSPRGCLLAAVAGAGAIVKPLTGGTETRIRVSDIHHPADAVFCESFEPSHSSREYSTAIRDLLGVTQPPLRIDSQCKYAVIARGEASVYLRLPTRKEYQHMIWDHAAGVVIVEEAGGRATGIEGEPLDFSLGRALRKNRGMVVTNGHLHEPVLAAVRRVVV